MKIAVFGTGSVGATIGSKPIQPGYEVTMGSCTAAGEKALNLVAEAGTNASEETYTVAAQFGEFTFTCAADVGCRESGCA
jgi:predicted dinucleotide-binding enzyme